MKNIFLVMIACLVQACSVTYTTEPVSEVISKDSEICIIENSEVRKEFIVKYTNVLKKIGFKVKQLSPNSSLNQCDLSSTYTAVWHWDLVTYMRQAEIVVYRNGNEVGRADYLAPSGWVNFTIEVYEDTEVKIEAMLKSLFPNA